MSVIRTAQLLFSLLFVGIVQTELHGENVCTGEQVREEIELVKQEQKVTITTYETCLDFKQGLRCKVQKEGTKIHYVNVPKKIKETVLQCCYGYYPTGNDTCVECEEGFYGLNCTQECKNCTENQICHHRFGCCDADQCGLAKSDAYQIVEKAHGRWIIPVFIVTVCAAGILLLGLIFYRKKYMKEKDPDLPTLSYIPQVKGYTPSVDETREFNNPLYRQSVTEAEAVKNDPDDVDWKGKKEIKVDSPQNEYATLDEVNESLAAGPSSRVPLMHDANKYEVPYRYTPSPESRIIENMKNIKKESN